MAYFLRIVLLAALLVSRIEAKDLGTYGATSSILEEDLILFIQNKIQCLSDEEQQTVMKELQSYCISQLKKPMEVKGIQKAKSYSVKYFDPSLCVDRDILDHEKQIIVKKGTSVNPLSYVSLNQELLFFDATDSDQLAWAESLSTCAKWILVKGLPMQLEEELNRPVYFDQGGVLTKKFGIQQVPARVYQDGLQLKIEFIPIGEGDTCVN